MKFLFLLLVILTIVAARFFDVCPGRRQSIGACLVGLCPAGSECINSYCCKHKKSAVSTVDRLEVEAEETSEYGTCPNQQKSIGECIANSCPLGYKCQAGNCCESASSSKKLKSRKEEEIPLKSSPMTIITVPPTESAESETHGSIDTDDYSNETNSNTTFQPDKEIIDEEDAELEGEEEEEEEESDNSSTTITTTEAPTTTRQEGRRKSKKQKSKKVKPTTKFHKITTIKATSTSTTTTTEPPSTTTTEVVTEEPEMETSPAEETTEPYFVCPVGAPIGECIANKCPEGHACVEGQCCILTPQINCTDALTGCLSHLCDRKGYRQFMTNNCAKTCARCHLVNITSNEIRDCRDRRSDCEEWAAEGFCESSLYTTRQKLKFCGKSCKLC